VGRPAQHLVQAVVQEYDGWHLAAPVNEYQLGNGKDSRKVQGGMRAEKRSTKNFKV
jgi:hypothetical protein